ncbi:MAG: type II toxin-antitoxin system PemK/MazF family toxin [Candidatus Saccharimonas sp.]|nr:type II toxin-antitoxin system PemK/MazF family toxin [Planctomycetaceae bacterium]
MSFDPQSGLEQQGRRPALVVSNDLFNKHAGLAFFCPITNTNRGFPFHLPVPAGCSLTGFVMVEQLKSLDYMARRVTFVERAPDEFVNDVLGLMDAITR